MPLSRLSDLEKFLIEQRLVEPLQLQETRRELGTRLDFDDLVKALEQRTFLTSYQAQKLLKRETEGLRVGRYKLQYRNASGSFARVFRATAVDDGQSVAIKLLRERHAADPRSVQLFRREGELGKRLQHKNIVPIYEVGSEGNQHYFAMEFVEGGNFRDFIKIRRKFSVPDATNYVLGMAEGLSYALTQRMTHRDLKLSNVLLSAQGVAKLVDFGLAGQDASLAQLDESVDRAIEYATLERGTGAPDNDPRSDLYFLGAIYYELLTGIPPYPPTKKPEERRQFSRYRDIRGIRELDPGLPRDVEAIVERLMCINPAERYQKPDEVVGDLQRALGGKSAEVQKPLEPDQLTVIVVENRKKQQDAFREYFTKHGFRVLMLSDPIRALNRIDAESIHSLVLVGDALEQDVDRIYEAAALRCKRRGTSLVLALSAKHQEFARKLASHNHTCVLSEGVTLRRIREEIARLATQISKS